MAMPLGSEHYSLLNMETPNGVLVVNKTFFEDFFQNFHETIAPKNDIRELLRNYRLDFFKPEMASTPVPSAETLKTMGCWIHVTNVCNLACDYCYIRKTTGRMEETTAINVINTIKSTIEKNNLNKISLSFAGGEPSLNIPVIRLFCRELGNLSGVRAIFHVTTNATNVTDGFITLLRDFGIRVNVSLDGVGKYNDARKFVSGSSSFDVVEKGLEKLTASIGTNKIAVGIVVSPFNVDGLDEITRFLLRRGIQFKYSFYRPNFIFRNGSSANPVSMKEFTVFCKKLLIKLKQCLTIIRKEAPDTFNPEPVVDKFSVHGNGTDAVCTMGQRYFAVGWNGAISRCHMIQDTSIGNISNESDLLEMLRTNKSPYARTGALCKTCEIKAVCRTGCRLLLDEKTQASVYHDVYRGIFDDYINTIAALIVKRGKPLNFKAEEWLSDCQ